MIEVLMKRFLLSVLCLISVTAVCGINRSSDTIYVAKYKADKLCAISYTFDDGLEEHFTLVFPRFEELGFRGTFWINGNTINNDELKRTEKPRVSWVNLKVMAEHGHEISNHGWSHKSLPRCTPEEVRVEIERNDSIILAKTGERPVTYCYAGNAKNQEIIRMASLNRVGTRTKQFAMGSRSTVENLESMVDTLLATHDWSVAMIHGITYGYDAFKSDTILWTHLEKVKQLEDKIWIATFKDVAAYTAEQRNVKLNVKYSKKSIEIMPETTLDKKIFYCPLTMVILNDIKIIKQIKQNGKQLDFSQLKNKTTFDFQPSEGKIVIRTK